MKSSLLRGPLTSHPFSTWKQWVEGSWACSAGQCGPVSPFLLALLLGTEGASPVVMVSTGVLSRQGLWGFVGPSTSLWGSLSPEKLAWLTTLAGGCVPGQGWFHLRPKGCRGFWHTQAPGLRPAWAPSISPTFGCGGCFRPAGTEEEKCEHK